MSGSDGSEGVGGHRSQTGRAIQHHVGDVVADGRCDGVGPAVAMCHADGSVRRNRSTGVRRCGDGVRGHSDEGGRYRVSGGDSGESVGRDRSQRGRAIQHHVGDIVADARRDGVGRGGALGHSRNPVRADRPAGSGTRGDVIGDWQGVGPQGVETLDLHVSQGVVVDARLVDRAVHVAVIPLGLVTGSDQHVSASLKRNARPQIVFGVENAVAVEFDLVRCERIVRDRHHDFVRRGQGFQGSAVVCRCTGPELTAVHPLTSGPFAIDNRVEGTRRVQNAQRTAGRVVRREA